MGVSVEGHEQSIPLARFRQGGAYRRQNRRFEVGRGPVQPKAAPSPVPAFCRQGRISCDPVEGGRMRTRLAAREPHSCGIRLGGRESTISSHPW